jgi:uncharacterized protein (TIGR00299 family) protein
MLFIDAENAGISGDMIIAALLDMGASAKKIDETLSPISDVIGKYSVKKKKVKRGVFNATLYRFNFEDKKISYEKALRAVLDADLSKRAREFAISCFETLTEAESTVHDVKIEDLKLHDVPDTIADIVVASALLDELGLLDTNVLSSPVNTGKGFFTFHGARSTLPAPATAEILKGKPIFGDFDMELTTPTGASLLVNLATDFVSGFPRMSIERIGLGAGYKDLDFPNVLKLYKGVERADSLYTEGLALLETNIDTASGEELGYLFEKLFDNGVLDVVIVPCVMKKNRPGHIVKALCRREDAETLSRKIMSETGSLGVRTISEAHRFILKKEESEEKIKIGGRDFNVRYKTGKDKEGAIISKRAEFEDLKKIAKETGSSLRDIKKHLEQS